MAVAVAKTRSEPGGQARPKRRGVGGLGTYLALGLALLLAGLPFIWVILSSLKTNAEIFLTPWGMPQTFRLQNYASAWTDGRFGTYTFNSVAIALPTVLLTLSCGSLAGFAFARLKFRGRDAIFVAMLGSIAISTNSIIVPLFSMIHTLQLVDTWWGVVLPVVASQMPLAAFLMRAFFRALPSELEDAARIDGCGDFGVFWHIMLPLARGALMALAIFSFMDVWNAFLLPLLVLREQGIRTIPVGLLIFQGQYLSDYAVLFAGIVISFIPSLILYFVLQRNFERGITIGAVTG